MSRVVLRWPVHSMGDPPGADLVGRDFRDGSPSRGLVPTGMKMSTTGMPEFQPVGGSQGPSGRRWHWAAAHQGADAADAGAAGDTEQGRRPGYDAPCAIQALEHAEGRERHHHGGGWRCC